MQDVNATVMRLHDEVNAFGAETQNTTLRHPVHAKKTWTDEVENPGKPGS
jgi:hypothetical protein